MTNSAQRVSLLKPVYGGHSLARIDGRAVFVPLTLPGEEASVLVQQQKSGYATAELVELHAASPERVAPPCAHFERCGGCHYQHARYAAQLDMKRAILLETLERAGVSAPASLECIADLDQAWQYRNRIRLAFDAAGRVGYRGRRSHTIVPIDDCPIAAPLLVRAALALATLMQQQAPAFKLAEVALFTNADESSLLLTLLAPSAKKQQLATWMSALAEQIPQLIGAELAVVGKASELPRTVERWGATSLTYRVADFDYRVDIGAFFQVNRHRLDAFVAHVLANHSGALAWDLYAGVGLFARQLTTRFERVVAVESAPASTQALAANLKGTRSQPVRAATLEFLRRPLAGPVPDLIVVDPPRAGLGAEVVERLVALAASELVYVSCDPATLARDLAQLVAGGYQISNVAVADLFPHTYHLETVVHLRHS